MSEMEEKLEKFKEAQEYLQEQSKNPDFIIDGNSRLVGDINLDKLLNLDFSDDIESELAVVHATDYSPAQHNAIMANELTGKQREDGTYSHRRTVHVTLNSRVNNNNGGDWTERTYNIIKPFSKINSEVVGFGAEDTFFKNKIDLTGDEIVLVPIEAKDKLTEEDKKMNIIYFEGAADIAVQKALIMMGYKPQSSTAYINENNIHKISEYRDKNNYGHSSHYMTKEQLSEIALDERDRIITELRNSKEIINTYKNKAITLEEIEAIIKNGYIEIVDTELNSEKIANLLTLYGISFTEEGPIMLETEELLSNYQKYNMLRWNEKAIKEGEKLEDYPELKQLYENYVNEQAKVDRVLNSKPQDVSLEEFQKNKFIVEYNKFLKKILKQGISFDSVELNRERLIIIDTDSENYLKDKEFEQIGIDTEDKSYANGMIEMDQNKSISENLDQMNVKLYSLTQILENKGILNLSEEDKELLTSKYMKSLERIKQNQEKEIMVDQIMAQLEQGIDVFGENTDVYSNYNGMRRGYVKLSVLATITFLISIGIIILGIILIKG